MAGKTKVNGTSYTIKGGKTKIGGTTYSIGGGTTKIGGTAKHISFNRLPSSFQEVEYIQSSGYGRNGQYIDINIYADEFTKVEMDLIFTSIAVYNPAIFGFVNALCLGLKGNNNFEMYCGRWYEASLTATTSVRYQISSIYSTSSCSLSVNGTTYISGSGTSKNHTYTMFLFNRKTSSGGADEHCASIKLFSTQIYNNSTLVRNFIPCYCTTTVTGYKGSTAVSCASGTIGMYDLANNRFYVNSGSGTFTKGGNV